MVDVREYADYGIAENNGVRTAGNPALTGSPGHPAGSALPDILAARIPAARILAAPFLSDLCHTFPLYSLGLGWAGAAAAAALMSHLAYRLRSRRVSQNETEAAA